MKRRLTLVLCVAFLLSLPLWAESRRYALILEDPPIAAKIASRRELRSKAAVDAGARIEAAQSSLRRQLAERKIRVTGSAKTLVNVVFVEASDRLQLEGLAGVRRVARLRPMYRHLDRALPLVKVPEALTVLAGAGIQNPGAGVQIGILDTGIDQTHPGFQDPSLQAPANRPACNDKPGKPGNNDCGYTNSKVIVARSYITMDAVANQFDDPLGLLPDDYSPRDRVGHGTAAAMVAAGVQHQAPLAAISGVAPKAYLGNYKIFGSPGVNDGTYGDALVAALEDAYADGMDIVSLSLGFLPWYDSLDTGATCGESTGLPCDVEAWFVESAVRNGMLVVVSAGNDGDAGLKSPALNTVSTPGTAPSALTVGASRNGHVLYSKVGLTAADAPANLRNLRASFGAGPNPVVTAPLRDVASLGNDGLACAALPASSLNGAIALVRRDPTQCDFATKARNAQAAGAAGIVIYLNGGDVPFPPVGVAGTGIPAAIVGTADGQALKSYLQSHADAQVVMDATLAAYNDPDVDTMADFSSRGPSIGYNEIKPEVVAPATGIYTATQRYDANSEMYSATRYTVAEGTSFSAPMVAGALALVEQKTGFSALQLKSAAVNTASTGIQDGGPARLSAVGGGKLNVQAAVQTNVTVDPATLSFGALAAGSLPENISLVVYNNSGGQLTLAIAQTTPDSNARLRLSQTTIPAGQAQTTVAIFLEGNLPAPGAYEGAITITGGAVPLRVPYSYLVSDNVLYNLFPINNSDFIGVVNDQIPYQSIALRATDQYGVPLEGVPVIWTGTQGGTTIDTAIFDPKTAMYGVAGAWVYLGPNPGAQEFTATVGTAPSLVFKFQGRARPQPTIDLGGVINAASQLAPPSGQGLAPGSYISVWGQNLAESNLDFNSTLPAGIDPYLPISLAGVHVSFDVPAQLVSVPGHLSYAGSRQLNVQIPWELQGQTSALMKVSMGGSRGIDTALYTVPISGSAPALFENPPGSGVAVAQDPFNPAVLFTTQHPAQKDQWVTFYGNGLGPVDHTPPSGDMTPPATQGLARCTKTVTVTIGGQSATVDFAGLTPTGIGYYQINVKVPANAPSGDQPVVLTADGVAGKTVSLRIQ